MNVFFHVALDPFGGECLGRLSQMLKDVADPGGERHVYVWGGAGARPGEEDFWSSRYPGWGSSLWDDSRFAGVSDPSRPFEVDRRGVARSVSDAFSDEAFRRKLDDIFREPRRFLGHNVPYDSAVVFCGSLGEPVGAAILLGMLAGLGRLRALGGQVPTVYCVLGAGGASSGVDALPELIRAQIARNLTDLGTLLSRAPAHAVVPVFLAGEEPIDGVPSDRAAQVTLGAAAVLGLTRSVVNDSRSPDRGVPGPFAFSIDTDRNVWHAGEAFDPRRPFAAAGAYVVQAPARKLAWLVAARVCEEVFALLSRQARPCRSLEECAALDVPPDLAAFLTKVEGETVERIWRRLEPG